MYSILGSEEDCTECTPDEMAAIIRDLRDKSGLISTHTYRLISYRNSFVGKDLVTWLVKYKDLKCKTENIEYNPSFMYEGGMYKLYFKTTTTHPLPPSRCVCVCVCVCVIEFAVYMIARCLSLSFMSVSSGYFSWCL